MGRPVIIRNEGTETELHTEEHKHYTWENGYDEESCSCPYVPTVQALYSFDEKTPYMVRLSPDSTDTFSRPIWLTPDAARALSSALAFGANDADELNKRYAD